MVSFSWIAKQALTHVMGVMVLAALLVACTETKERHPGAGDIESAALRLENGTFDDGLDWWWGTENIADSMTAETGALCVTVPGGLANPWDAIVGQSDLDLIEGISYQFRFTAWASNTAALNGQVQEPNPPYTAFVSINDTVDPTPMVFERTFTMGATDQIPMVDFQIGSTGVEVTFCFDDISIEPMVTESVANGGFDDGLTGWWTDDHLTSWDVSSGAFCAEVAPSSDPSVGVLGQSGIAIEADVPYLLSFLAAGDPQPVTVLLRDSSHTPLFTLPFTPTADGERVSGTFTATATLPDAELVFQFGGAATTFNICIDNVSLWGIMTPPRYQPDTGPRVRVNQVGYLPFGPKVATLVTEAVTPLPFTLVDAGGAVVFAGDTVPFGTDASSALNVHTLDFTAFTTVGEGYTITADEETSYPFAIREADYEALRVDTLSFYYPQRSGTVIDGAVAGAEYARPAGHVSAPDDGDINLGDRDVPCQPPEESEPIYGEPWTCGYTLDVTGGWYDAGDQGKYIVNGGISVFQLLNLFERTKLAPTSDLGALGDGSLRIPESGNGIPDVLDEARFELEFFLKMIVPEGNPFAGMAHHKVHDLHWTGLPLWPHEDPNVRQLHRPSTAATLNLAAAAAQGARIFARYDAVFADKLLNAARKAWAAALANPELYAPIADGADGGGAYQDYDVSDEFYWAAAELYLTTGEGEFLDYVLGSALHTAEVFTPAGISWFSVAALARMDLAAVPSALPDRDAVIESVIQGAEGYLNDQLANGFGQPYDPPGGTYVWGSNSQILNNLVVLAAAYDLSGDERFRQGVLKGIDYILGRNALNVSYVTSYGDVFSENIHSRWYAHQLNPAMPLPPAGTVAGGPNSESGSWDPTLAALYPNADCPAQYCYVDDVNSWSTNELTVNWNAPLAWLASFIADQDTAEASETVCEVSYIKTPQCSHSDTFYAWVRLTNTGSETIKNWQLSWSFFGDQTVDEALGAKVEQDGAMVTLKPKRRKNLHPGTARNILLTGDIGNLATATPGTFFLNGNACRLK